MAEPVYVPVAEPAPTAGSEAPTPTAARRPRGRTALLIAAAAVLGIAGGTAVGYGVQADRAPTPLPALSQPDLGYPAKALPADKVPDPLPVSQDRQLKTDGDLRRLLVDRPSGARKSPRWQDGYESLPEYALFYDSEDFMYETLAKSGIRRVAAVGWRQGQYRDTNVHLVQFRSGSMLGASELLDGQLDYMPYAEDGAGNGGDPIKGSGNGRYYLYKVKNKPGYMPSYRARALAQRGDVMLDINIFDTAPISKKDIRTLAERQLERL
ncbi:hypothetical protein ABZS81_16380 [Streptomyces sp. NPDC005318]|uniref:hypothetical protein n=1 Tax=Streptomyces sp. NPDC005318 TaxID=3157031 RepID=UPI0033B3BE3E